MKLGGNEMNLISRTIDPSAHHRARIALERFLPEGYDWDQMDIYKVLPRNVDGAYEYLTSNPDLMWNTDDDGNIYVMFEKIQNPDIPNPDMYIVIRLRAAREAAGMTQADLARKINTTQAQIAKYENGDQDMTIARFLEICGAIGVDPVEIVKK